MASMLQKILDCEYLLGRVPFLWPSIPVVTGDMAANGSEVEVDCTVAMVEDTGGSGVTAVVAMEVGCNRVGGVTCSSYMASR